MNDIESARVQLGDVVRATVHYWTDPEDKERAFKLVASQTETRREALKIRPSLSAVHETHLPLTLLALAYIPAIFLVPALPEETYSRVFFSVLLILGLIGLLMLRARGLLRPALQQSTIIITICAALTYALVRYTYVRYYQPFHVSPEEIGFDYRAVLSGQFGYILRRWAQLSGLALSIYAIYRIVVQQNRMWALFWGAILLTFSVAVCAFIYLDDLKDAGNVGYNITHGGLHEVGSSPFAWPPVFRTLVDRAPSADSAVSVPKSSNLIYLGNSGGITTLFDGDTTTTIRLPAAQYLVRTYRTDRVLGLKNGHFITSNIYVLGVRSFYLDIINDDVGTSSKVRHNITIPELDRSLDLSENRNFVKIQPTKEGSYTFYCRFDRSMKGTIRIESDDRES